MKLFRAFAWNERAGSEDPDGPLWFPRRFQGDGRHDNPELYGCLYLSEIALSPIVEQLARFRTQKLLPTLLRRRGLPLALAELDLSESARLVDLDDPAVLTRERLQPSRVATRDRVMTQALARRIHDERAEAAGMRWWSVHESLWMNVTLFDRAAGALELVSVRRLAIDDADVQAAAESLGLRRE